MANVLPDVQIQNSFVTMHVVQQAVLAVISQEAKPVSIHKTAKITVVPVERSVHLVNLVVKVSVSSFSQTSTTVGKSAMFVLRDKVVVLGLVPNYKPTSTTAENVEIFVEKVRLAVAANVHHC